MDLACHGPSRCISANGSLLEGEFVETVQTPIIPGIAPSRTAENGGCDWNGINREFLRIDDTAEFLYNHDDLPKERERIQSRRFDDLLQELSQCHHLELSAARVQGENSRALLKQLKDDPKAVDLQVYNLDEVIEDNQKVSASSGSTLSIPPSRSSYGFMETQRGVSSRVRGGSQSYALQRVESGDSPEVTSACASEAGDARTSQRTVDNAVFAVADDLCVKFTATVDSDARDSRESRMSRRSSVASLVSHKFKVRHAYTEQEASRILDRRISFCRTKSEKSLLAYAKMSSPEEEHVSWLQKFVLHPNRGFRLMWDLVSMLFLAYDFFIIPFVGAFDPPTIEFMTWANWITLIFWTADMWASAFTGYQRGSTVILDPHLIISNYLRTWFLLDLLIVCLDWALVIFGAKVSAARLGRSLRLLRFIRALRLVRIVKLKRIIQAIQDQINTEAVSIAFGIVKIVLVLIVSNHLVACCWYGLGAIHLETGVEENWIKANYLDKYSLMYRYFTSLHWSLTQFTPASMDVVPVNTDERIFTVIVILFAMIMFSSFLSILTASMTELRRLANDESRQFWMLRRYLKDWGVSRDVGIRMQRYLEYAYHQESQRVQERDVALLRLLSEPLREELKLETFAIHLSGHPLFKHSQETIRFFNTAIVQLSFAQGDRVFSCGDEAAQVLFLSSGMLEYTLGDLSEGLGSVSNAAQASGEPTEMEYLIEGQWICEAVLWTSGWLNLGDLRSLTACQAIAIDAAKFAEKSRMNKRLWAIVKMYAGKFVEALNEMKWYDLSDMIHQYFAEHQMVDVKVLHWSPTGNLADARHQETTPRRRMSLEMMNWLPFNFTKPKGEEEEGSPDSS